MSNYKSESILDDIVDNCECCAMNLEEMDDSDVYTEKVSENVEEIK